MICRLPHELPSCPVPIDQAVLPPQLLGPVVMPAAVGTELSQLKAEGSALGSMQDRQHIDVVSCKAVGHHEREPRNDQLADAIHPTSPSSLGKPNEVRRRCPDALTDGLSCRVDRELASVGLPALDARVDIR